jgi:hypothetical protein
MYSEACHTDISFSFTCGNAMVFLETTTKTLHNCSLYLETQRPAKMFIGRNMRGEGL